jgi:tetratricopeptide (TPR) repeat protein
MRSRKAILGIVAAGSSYIVGGAILDAVSNAISQINWSLTIIGTLVSILLWLTIRIILKKHPIQWHNYRVTRLGYYPTCAFVGIILLLWTPPILKQFNYRSEQGKVPSAISPNQKEAKIVVLLSDFAGPDPDSYGVTKIIHEQLTDATKGYQDVKIKRLYQSIDTSEVAQTKGTEAQADIVLWGSYFANQSNTRVIAHFEVIEKTFDIPLREDKEIISAKTAKLESFTMQEQLSKEMSYLVLLTVGIIQVEDSDFDGAITSFTKALSLSTVPEQIINPKHLYDYRAICYLMKGTLDEALYDYSQALSLERDADMFLMRGFIYTLQGKSSQALNDINSSLSIEPTDQLYALRGYIYLYLVNDYQLAMADFNKAIELNPNSVSGHINRSVLYSWQGNFEAAITDVDIAISLSPSSKVYNNRGTVYSAKGDIEKALADYSQAIELEPNDASYYSNRGSVYAQHHNLDKALADLDTAIMLDPKYGRAYTTRGNVYKEKGLLDEAIVEYTKAIELKDGKAYGDYYNRGLTYHQKGEFDRAIEDHSQAIKLNPQFADAYGNRCNTYLSKKNFDLAISDCNKAIKLNPKQSMAYNNRGAALASKRNFAYAMADFNKAIALDNKNMGAYFNRGTAYAEQGKKSDAVADFRRVIELGGDEFFVKSAKRNLCALGEGDC